MRKLKAKWATLLVALSCFAVCLGVGVTTIEPPKNSIVTASAETTYTEYNVSDLIVHVHSTAGNPNSNNTSLWLFGTGDTSEAWADYTCVSGDGIKLNGEAATVRVQDFSGGLYLSFDAVNVGDVISIGGTFVNEARATKYVLPNSSFIWAGTGSGWFGHAEAYTDAQLAKYDTVTIHRLGLGTEKVIEGTYDGSGLSYKIDENNTSTGIKFRFGYNSTNTAAGELAIRLRGGEWEGFHFQIIEGVIRDINGEWLAVPLKSDIDWDIEFGAIDTADNTKVWIYIKLNGVIVTTKTLEKTSYSAYTTKSVSIYAGNIAKTTLAVAYETSDIGALTVHSNNGTAGVLYLAREDGKALPVENWEKLFTADSADNFKVNGVNATLNEMKSTPDGLYLSFGALSAGDIISFGGVFTGVDYGAKYVIEDSSFKWNGSAWVKYVEYQGYTLSNLQVANTSMAGGAYCANNKLSLKMDGGATVSDWPWFVYESGAGFKVNGESAALTGNIANAIQDTTGGLYLVFNEVNAGDFVSIGGTFVNEDLAIRYTIPESKFTWTGSEWKEYVEYTVHNLGALTFQKMDSENKHTYLKRADGQAVIPPNDGNDGWTATFTKADGVGIILNNNAVTPTLKFPGCVFLEFGSAPSQGDILTIGGTFVNEDTSTKYVITESKFVWNGSAWEKYVEYTEHNVSNLTVHANSTTNTVLWISMTGGATVSDWPWFKYVSGAGFKVNGETAELKGDTANAIQDFGGGLYLKFAAVEPGDIVSIGGTFTNVDLALRYVIPESQFVWTGSGWNKCNYYTDSQLAAYDVVTLVDLGLGLEKTVEGIYDGSLLTYAQSAENTTGSVKFRFQVNSVDTSSGATAIRLRGSAWSGVRFEITEGVIRTWNETANSQRLPLSNNTDYEVELGAIDVLNSNYIWAYIKIDGLFMASEMLLKTEISDTEDADDAEYGTYNTNAVSLYVNTTGITFTDPDHVSVTYEASCGSSVDYVEKDSSYAVLDVKAKTYDTCVGWIVNETLYQAGDTIAVGEENIILTALEIDFRLENGAAIRIADAVQSSGIRFITLLKESDLSALEGYVKSVTYGTLIIPYDYLSEGQAPNLEDFTPDENILKIKSSAIRGSEKWEVSDGYVVYRGAMQNIYAENYERLFAGRGYMEITLKNDVTITVYTPFDKENNVRSIRYVAQAFKADTTEPAEGELRYNNLSDTKKAVVDTYAASDSIDLMDYAAYAANNFFTTIAWNYPVLDESNEYNNETNIAIATQMKNTGIKVVNLTGKNLLVLNTQEAIEKTRQIIKFFWSQGLKTVAFAANNFENTNVDFTVLGTPDFSDCEGFIGFLHWDEPTENDDIMAKLADLAIEFDKIYAGTDVTYMVNLLPSYASYFQKESSSWFGNSTTLDKAAYKAYVEEYCTKVLSQVKGEKWLSVDSYPINANKTLHDTFLFDLGVIKYYAMQNDAHAHIALQSSGFANSSDDSKNRIPTEAEMRMQAYAALAFGMDSISWFTYSPSASDSETFFTFVDNNGNITDQTAYDAFTAVNTELNAIGAVYSAFKWKGIILGRGDKSNISDWSNEDYNAYSTVMGQIGDYQLSVGNTKHLSSVATNKSTLNYLMGVMEDGCGNEGYVLCNYNSHEKDRAQTITLTFNKKITEVVIYRAGVAQTVSVDNNSLDVSLATGEGVIILPSKLG